MVGCAIVTILAGPGGRQYVLGSLEWSTGSYPCFPYGLKISSWPGRVYLDRSPLGPSYQTPVKSGGPGVAGGASPVNHHAPVSFDLALAGDCITGCDCPAAGFAARVQIPHTAPAAAIAVRKRSFILCLPSIL